MASIANNDSAGGARASTAWWPRFYRMSEAWWTRNAGRAAVEAACASRCAEMIAFARERSTFYREAWRDLPRQASR